MKKNLSPTEKKLLAELVNAYKVIKEIPCTCVDAEGNIIHLQRLTCVKCNYIDPDIVAHIEYTLEKETGQTIRQLMA